MPSWVEAKIRNRLWIWLQDELEYDVYPEVDIKKGQIDLVGETPKGQNIGFEIKGCPNPDPKILKQLRRYEKSGRLDKLYFVSNRTQFLEQLFEDTSGEAFGLWKLGMFPELMDFNMDLDTPKEKKPALQHIEDWVGNDWQLSSLANSVGIIQVPIGLEREDERRVTLTEGCESILQPHIIESPEIIREAKELTRTDPIQNSSKEERLQFQLWREFGGIPEGSLPHPDEGSGRNTLNIDLITFRDAVSPTETLKSEGETIGVEVKTETGLKSGRVGQQLRNYIESECLTRLYLCAPKSNARTAKNIISRLEFKGSSKIGLLTVERGEISKEIEAGKFNQKFDAFGSEDYPNYVGFGNAYMPKNEGPLSLRSV